MNQIQKTILENPKRKDSFWKCFLFFRAIKNGNLKKIESLLNQGFDPNANRYQGLSSVSLGVKYGNLQTVQILLNFGADPNSVDETTGMTPLIHSILEEGLTEILLLLIHRGVDLNQKDGIGMSPLHHCVNEGKLEPFRILLENGANPNIQDRDGVTCMNLAKSSHGMFEFAELLFKHGADPTIKDKHGKIYLM
ncbi:ankyrin repeat domain-containing protein [Leptospira sp. WS92.C1]